MDRIVCQMPDNLRQFLIAMAVMQEFQMQIVVGANQDPPTREKDFVVVFRMDEKFKYLEPCLKVVKENTPEYDYTGWTEWSRGEYDCYIDFDFNKAADIVRVNRRHITEGFGVLLGTFTGAIQYGVFPQCQPILGPLMLSKRKDSEVRVLIIHWDYDQATKFQDYLVNNYPEFNVLGASASYLEAEPMELLPQDINRYDVVIGKYSSATYIAASLNKVVLEIFPTEDEYYLYNNNTINCYESVVGNPSAELVWSLWEDVWQDSRELTLDMRSPDQTPQTDSNQFIVETVEEK